MLRQKVCEGEDYTAIGNMKIIQKLHNIHEILPVRILFDDKRFELEL